MAASVVGHLLFWQPAIVLEYFENCYFVFIWWIKFSQDRLVSLWVVRCRTCDREVVGSTPARCYCVPTPTQRAIPTGRLMSSSLRATGWRPSAADWGSGISVVLRHGSTCPLSRAVDGCIPRRGTISSCLSAAASKIVKRCCSQVSHVSSAISSIPLPSVVTLTLLF